MTFYYWEENILFLKLQIMPNAKQDEIIGIHDDYLKIKIKAAAQENKANIYLQKYLAKSFKVPKTNVNLLKGAQARKKLITIKEPKHIPSWIKEEE